MCISTKGLSFAGRVPVIALFSILLLFTGCPQDGGSGGTGNFKKHAIEPLSTPPTLVKTDIREGMTGVDLEGMDEQQRDRVLTLLNEITCNCGCATATVAQCAVVDPDCAAGSAQVKNIIEGVKSGQTDAEIVRSQYVDILGSRFRHNFAPLLDAIDSQNDKEYMVAKIAENLTNADPKTLKTTQNELEDARDVASLFLGDRYKELLKYMEDNPDELYLMHGITYQLMPTQVKPVFEYYFFRHRPEEREDIFSYLNPTVPADQMIISLATDLFSQPPPEDGYSVSPGDSPSMGPADAPIVLIEYSDFQCPYSKRIQATLEKVMEQYDGKVLRVYKNYPLSFHKAAKLAAQAALAAGKQDKFWAMHEKIFENQRALSEEKLIELAKDLGLDVEKFKADMNSLETVKQVETDMIEASRIGVQSTPTVFVNDVMVKGAQGFCAFMEIIEDQLKNK